MKVLETILSFLTTVARILFRHKRKPAAGSKPCPGTDPLPAPDEPPRAPDAGNRSDDDLHRSDTLTDNQGHPGKINIRPTDITGCFLMIAGAGGCLYKWFF